MSASPEPRSGSRAGILLAPTSPGDLLDRITILEIKSERIRDEAKLVHVRRELEALRDVWSRAAPDDETIAEARESLREVNEALWEIEDELRRLESERRFDERFIELARAVYATNDRRARAKRRVSLHLGSEIVEEKSYGDAGREP